MNQDTKESLMIVAGGNIGEYERLRRVGVEDFIIRYSGYVNELELQKQAVEPLKKKNVR